MITPAWLLAMAKLAHELPAHVPALGQEQRLGDAARCPAPPSPAAAGRSRRRPARSRSPRPAAGARSLSGVALHAGVDAVGGAVLLAQGPGALVGDRAPARRRPGIVSGIDRGQPAAHGHHGLGGLVPVDQVDLSLARARRAPAAAPAKRRPRPPFQLLRNCSAGGLHLVHRDTAVHHRHGVVRAGTGSTRRPGRPRGACPSAAAGLTKPASP